MPSYRLIFPVPEGFATENAATAEVQTGDRILTVGDEIEHGGTLWRVSQAPLDQPTHGETADVMVWPAG
jgi:hypothetical protein